MNWKGICWEAAPPINTCGGVMGNEANFVEGVMLSCKVFKGK